MRGRVRSVKEMRPHDEKLTEKMAETRLGIWRGKGTAWATRTHDGELGKRMHGGGVGGRARAAERGGGEGSGGGGGGVVREEGQVAARRIAYENKVLSDVCAQHS